MSSLTPGTRLGPFEVIGVLGAGGMGEVYRARDTTLDREVALKVLPQAVAGTPERLARFEREARLLAAMNHPHIGAIYGIEDDEARRALVLELVEGPTLDDLIEACARRGEGMPIPDAIAVARQIALALDAAREKGIIHRDLKPANVKVRPDGVVKVLDFGLGRGGMSGDSGVAQGATIASDAPRWSPDDRLISYQRAGLLLAASLDVVRVADRQHCTLAHAAWLRGHSWLPDGSAIVYSGSRGSTMAYPPTNNLRLVTVDGREDRQLTFGDIAYHDPHVDESGRIVATRVRSRSDIWRIPVDGPPAENVRHAVQVTHQTGSVQTPAVSPDGTGMVYISDLGGHSNLWLSAFDGSGSHQLTFESDPEVSIGVPAWSPDGTRVAFVVVGNGRLDLCLTGTDGSGLALAATGAYAPCWAADGRTVYCNTGLGHIQRLDVETGAMTPVRSDNASSPVPMPDGRGIYFVGIPEEIQVNLGI